MSRVNLMKNQLFGNSEQFKLRGNEKSQEMWFTITLI